MDDLENTKHANLSVTSVRTQQYIYDILCINDHFLEFQVYLLRTWKAVNLCLGSEFSIFLTRSLAAGEMEGHGSLVKSMWPRKIALKIPCSASVIKPIFS